MRVESVLEDTDDAVDVGRDDHLSQIVLWPVHVRVLVQRVRMRGHVDAVPTPETLVEHQMRGGTEARDRHDGFVG